MQIDSIFIVGLTGGIGSGKSAAAKFFREYGVMIVNADQVAREVVEPGTPALEKIAARFGDEVLQNDGSLNRQALRKIVFDHTEERLWLEQLTHPLIGQSILDQLGAPHISGEPRYRILESPLLLETSQIDLVQRLCLVDVPVDVQIERVTIRDNADEMQTRAIIAAQMSREEKLSLADDVIDNSGDLDHLATQVKALHEQYQSIAENQHEK